MANAIWKYPVETTDEFVLNMPHGAEVLSVQTQNGSPNIWAKVESDNARENRYFVVRGTGHPFNGDEGKFLGTYQLYDGTLVFHLFERGTH